MERTTQRHCLSHQHQSVERVDGRCVDPAQRFRPAARQRRELVHRKSVAVSIGHGEYAIGSCSEVYMIVGTVRKAN